MAYYTRERAKKNTTGSEKRGREQCAASAKTAHLSDDRQKLERPTSTSIKVTASPHRDVLLRRRQRAYHTKGRKPAVGLRAPYPSGGSDDGVVVVTLGAVRTEDNDSEEGGRGRGCTRGTPVGPRLA